MMKLLAGNLGLQTVVVQDYSVRRLIDIIVALLALILLSPVMLLIAILIKLSSPGKVLIQEPRVGRRINLEEKNPLKRMAIFGMYRFRTARNSDAYQPRMVSVENMTRIGYLLQKTSLDELPEFINVLKGDMSLIGPRPILAHILERDYEPVLDERFTLKPGMTGLWQVTRLHIGTLHEMALVDKEYMENRSLWMDLSIVLRTFPALVKRSHVQHWVHESIVTVQENPVYNLMKRLMDIFLSLVGLILLSPLLLAVAIIIRLDSPGPVIFTQIRGGKRVVLFAGGDTHLVTTNFKIYKFRTMYNVPEGNDKVHKTWVQNWVTGKLNSTNDPEKVVKPTQDRRITRIGRFLRVTSIDELPQLLNVLKGDMSLVGPRPVPVYEIEAYEKHHYQRLDATPGLTCWWQIKQRGSGTLDQMVELDLEYMHHRSLWSDIKILFLTVPAVLTRRGAK